jgi:imidazolonepropionase-like amidohydrolase
MLVSPDGSQVVLSHDSAPRVAALPAGDGPFSIALDEMGALYDSSDDEDSERAQADVGAGSAKMPTLAAHAPAGAPPEGGELPWWRTDRQLTWSLGRTYFIGPQRTELLARVRRDHPQGSVLLTGARIISMGAPGILAQGDILVVDNRIRAVGPTGTLAVPGDTTRIDLAGKTVLPGYFPTHDHVDAQRGVHSTRVWQYLLALSYGTTSIHDPQGVTVDRLSYADMLETGAILGPRHFSTGAAVMQQSPLETWEETRDLVRRYSRFYHTDSLKQRDSGQRLLRQWIAQAAFEERLTTVGHWYYGSPVNVVLDGYSGLEHGWLWPWSDDVVQLIARSGSIYTPTTMAGGLGPSPLRYFADTYNVLDDVRVYRFAERSSLAYRDIIAGGLPATTGMNAQSTSQDSFAFHDETVNAAKLVAAGGKVGVASDGYLMGLGVHWEMWTLVMGGMTPLQALQSATWTGAVATGHERDLGSIEPGKLADLQILDKNPLNDIHNSTSISRVMKNGRLYDAMTLDELWPNPRKLLDGPDDAPWWWAEWPGVP